MHRALSILLLLPLLLGATYYVDPLGNDTTGDGSSGNPWATLQKGIDNASNEGDTVCVNDGLYTATFTASVHSGIEGLDITIRNCEGGIVTIDSSEKIINWISSGTNLWDSTFSGDNDSYVFRQTTWLEEGQSCAAVDAQDEWCTPSAGVIRVYNTSNPNLEEYSLLVDQNTISQVSYITLDGIGVKFATIALQIGTTSTDPGPDTSFITVKNIPFFNYTSTRGIRAIGTSENPTHDLLFDTGSSEGSYDTASGNGHCIKFDSNENGNINYNVEIRNWETQNCWFHGIQFSNGWDNIEAHHNNLHGAGLRSSGSGAQIRCGQDVEGCHIHHNEISCDGNSTASGIYLQENVSGARIHDNVVRDCAWHGLYNFATVITSGFSSDNRVYNNLFYNLGTSCIRVEESAGLESYSNSMNNCGSSSLAGTGAALSLNSTNADGIVFYNNAVNTVNGQNIVAITGATLTSNFNVYYKQNNQEAFTYQGTAYNLADYQAASGNDSNSQFSDPLYTNPSSADFSLQPLSPARFTGYNLNSIFTEDYAGTLRGRIWDIGAYESGVETRIQGLTIN